MADVGPFYAAHFRYFETNDRGIAHPSPIQGDWTVDGVGLEPSAGTRSTGQRASARQVGQAPKAAQPRATSEPQGRRHPEASAGDGATDAEAAEDDRPPQGRESNQQRHQGAPLASTPKANTGCRHNATNSASVLPTPPGSIDAAPNKVAAA